MTTATVIGIIVGYLFVGFAFDVFYMAIKFWNTESDSAILVFNIFFWPCVLLPILIFVITDQLPRFLKFIEKHVTYSDDSEKEN